MVPGAEIKICLIEHAKFEIIIMDAPSDANSAAYVKQLKMLGVTDVVRACEPTYSLEKFERENIQVHEMMFPDGGAPPDELIDKWTDLIYLRYKSKNPNESGIVAVHCVAGLGRAPVMAAIALVEITGMDPLDAVEKIRERQKGAINARQLAFLTAYKPRRHKTSVKCRCFIL